VGKQLLTLFSKLLLLKLVIQKHFFLNGFILIINPKSALQALSKCFKNPTIIEEWEAQQPYGSKIHSYFFITFSYAFNFNSPTSVESMETLSLLQLSRLLTLSADLKKKSN